jgi:hypothetical protein
MISPNGGFLYNSLTASWLSIHPGLVATSVLVAKMRVRLQLLAT